MISGSVLCGETAKDAHDYLGRYALQVSVDCRSEAAHEKRTTSAFARSHGRR